MNAPAILALALATAATAHSSPPPRWQGTAVGGVVQTRRYVSTDGRVVADDTSEYRGRLTFAFHATKSGTIRGTGSGIYTTVAWHETGTVDGNAFSCDAPKTAQAFRFVVTGRSSGGTLHLDLSIPAATEVLAANVDCGYGHYLVAGTTTYLRDSLAAVGGATLHFRRRRAVVLQPSRRTEFTQAAAQPTLPGTFHVSQQHNWTIEVKTR